MRIASIAIPFLGLISSLTTTLAAESTVSPTYTDKTGTLYTDTVSYCAEAKAVLVDQFQIAYHQSNTSLTFSFSLASVEGNLNTSVNLYVNAYGIQILNDTIDLCDILQGVICPLPQVNFTGESTAVPLCEPATADGGSIWALFHFSRVIEQRARCLASLSSPGTSLRCTTQMQGASLRDYCAFSASSLHPPRLRTNDSRFGRDVIIAFYQR